MATPMTRTRAAAFAHAPGDGRGCRGRRLVIRWLLLALVFAGVQNLLGAWVVPWTAGGSPVAEVCTPQGLQWVRLDGAGPGAATVSTPGTGDSPAPQLAPGCVWALAHVSLIPMPRPVPASPAPVIARGALADWALARPPGQDGPVRVLLMAPMRAPPVSAA